MIRTDRLPNAYQEVEYISSNGGQYIDTGFIPDNNTAVEVKIKASANTNNGWVFGARQAANVKMYGVILHNNGRSYPNQIRSDYGTGNENDGAIIYYNSNVDLRNNIKIIFKDKNNLYVDGNLVGQNTIQTFTCPVNLYLFKINSANGGNHNSYTTMYYAKIWDGSTLIRYYIPCYRKSDNAIGMYDLVNSTFAEGVGTFTKGNDVGQYTVKKIMAKVGNSIKEIEYIKTKVNGNMVKVYDKLPSEYQRYDYVWLPQSSGSSSEPRVGRTTGALMALKQYSNLDELSYEIEFEDKIVYPSNYNVNLIGGRSYSGVTNSLAFYLNGRYVGMVHLHGLEIFTNLSYALDTRYRVKYTNTTSSPSYISIGANSEDLAWSNTVSIPNTRLHLFANPTPSDLSSMSNFAIPTVRVKIGKVKIYDLNGNLINKYIPCIRKSDNQIGMYDIIEGIFYTTYQAYYATLDNTNCIYEVGNW